MTQGRLKARLGPSASKLRREAFELTLQQPRKAGICETAAEYLAAPTLPGYSYEEIAAMSPVERGRLKRKIAKHLKGEI
jgi:hypothetical protein